MKADLNRLVQKFRKDKLSVYEELILAEKLSDPKNHEATQLIREGFDESIHVDEIIDKDLRNTLSQIHHTIHLRETQNKTGNVRRLITFTTRITAVLFLPLLIITAYLWFQNNSSTDEISLLEIAAPAGSRVHFELPDGTIGTLAGDSKLSYNSDFKVNRELEINGQAYFDVAHDKKHPFRIAANGNTVEVIGTRFSLSACPDEDLTDLILEEGKVIFKSALAKEKYEMRPGERLLKQKGIVQRSTVETWKYTAWKDGRLVLRNDSMEELAKRIEKWYHVDVQIESPSLNEYTFRGVFEDESLEEVLGLLKMTSSINYKIEERKLNPDGTFTKKKVIFIKK